MPTEATALTLGSHDVRWGTSDFPLGTVLLSVVACLIAPSGSYAVVALAVVWFPYLVMHPQAGLWFSPVLVMVASLLASPTGFIAGWGYSPQLVFWAVAISITFAATGLAAISRRTRLLSRAHNVVRTPLALYAFFGISVVGALVGLQRGYSLSNVGKQFFGCLLFVGYFWFALKLTPSLRDIRRVVRFVAISSLVAGLVYVLVYVPSEGLVRDTILNDFCASVACLLLPQVLSRRTDVKAKAAVMCAGLMLVPLVNTFKRSVAGFAICVLLLYGLRAESRKRRMLWLLGAFTLFALLLTTPILNYVGRAVAKEPVISKLVPANVQTNYSVFLRVFEAGQMLMNTGGPSMLGTGLGSTLKWYDPYSKMWFTQETVDNGWAYLLIKLGIVGLVTFTWLIGSLLMRAVRKVPSGAHLALLFLVVFFTIQMVASDSFVYFMDAAWAGMACGWLHVMNSQDEILAGRTPATAAISPRRLPKSWRAGVATWPEETAE